MNPIVEEVRLRLRQCGDAETRESSKKFFKEEVRAYGVKTPTVRRIAKDAFRDLKDKPKGEIFLLCEDLWKSGVIEESFVACSWSLAAKKSFAAEDFRVFERWIELYVSNWASCDTLCNHTVGEFLEMYPDFVAELRRWTESGNRWVRRASAVSLIVPARNGFFLDNVFDIAERLLTDADDLVQKGYGWMLKAASQAHPSEVLRFVLERRLRMPRTALRYAIEKLSPEDRRKAMEKEPPAEG